MRPGWFWVFDDWVERHNAGITAVVAAVAGVAGFSSFFGGMVTALNVPLLGLSLAVLGTLAISDWICYPLTLWTKSTKRGWAEVFYRAFPVVLVTATLFFCSFWRCRFDRVPMKVSLLKC